MKYCLIVLLCLPFWGISQNNTKPYFQQEVNYKIAVSLDDVNHTISGNIEFEYINNSPDALPEIWMHLWGNAFKNRKSAFDRQKLRLGKGKYYFADEKDLGGYKGLDFTADGAKIAWDFDPKNPDIAVLKLSKPLAPGARIRIATPLNLKIPASFSRLGHVGTSYQMTQWYPKPAVYDNKGWHAMPYLDMGEFYSEFGSFDVTITLPDNYVVAATGILQTPSEIEFLDKKVAETKAEFAKGVDKKPDTFPASSATMKTVHYTADLVHDFAWFADKRFWVLHDTAHLASGRSVDCWAMFTNAQAGIWQQGATYVRKSVEFYSEKVGEYPWPQATALHSALSAGGGMEYPMITVIGNSSSPKDLDDVITHEVGHNWFYGILGSNEREHPFMDEGINSYYESRYMKHYYADYAPYEMPKKLYDPAKLGSILETGYLLLARDHKDTPPDTHSDKFSEMAYGLEVYSKTSLCFNWLEQAVGTAKLDAAMQEYYQKWQFRHPYPEDLKAILTRHGINTQWFFESLQTKKQADYALKNVVSKGDGNWELTVKKIGALGSPYPVTALKNGVPIATQWVMPPTGDENYKQYPTLRKVEITAPGATAFVIDRDRVTLDVNRKNNARRTSGLFPGSEPWQLKMLAPFQNTSKNTIGVLPWLGWNNADKTMLGLVLYHPFLPSRKLQVFVLPGFAFGSKNLVGIADMRYRFYPGGPFRKVTVGVGAKTFDFDYNPTFDYYSRFYRIVPQIRAELNTASLSFQHSLNFRTLFVGREEAAFSFEGDYNGKTWHKNTIHELRYEGRERRLPNPYRFAVALETQQYRDVFDRKANYLRGTVEWQQQFFYKAKRKVSARLFAGYFLQSTQRNRSVEETALTLNPQGFNDYKFDQTYLARTGGAGILGRQVSQTEGGFKGAFGEAFAGVLGNSNNYVMALNLKADLPQKLPLGIPLKPYFDIGYFDDATPLGQDRPSKEQLLWNGGLMLEFMKGGLEIYFPLFSSETLKRQYCEQGGGTNNSAIFCGGNYLKMISWSLKVNLADPVEMVEGMVR